MLILPRHKSIGIHVYEHHTKMNGDVLHTIPKCGIPLTCEIPMHNIIYAHSLLSNYPENYLGEVPFIVCFTEHICFTGKEVYISDQLKAKLKANYTPNIIYRFIWDMHKSDICFWTPNIVLNKTVETQHSFLRDAFNNIYKTSLSESLSTDIYHLQDYIVQTKKSVLIPFYLAKQQKKTDMELVYIPIMKACTCPTLLSRQSLCSGLLEYTRILLFSDE